MIRRLAKRAAKKALSRLSPDEPEAPRDPRPRAAPEPTERETRPPEPQPEPDLEVDGATAVKWAAEREDVVLLDIREAYEVARGHARDAILVPMNQVPHRLSEIPKGRLVVYCAAGARSFGVTDWLRRNGYPESYSLQAGLGAYASAGGDLVRPAVGAAYPLTSRVRLLRDTVDGLTLPEDRRVGTVQEVVEVDGERRYTVGLLDEDDLPLRVSDVTEDELERA